MPPLEKGEYEDVNADGASIDTASLPGIEMQDNDATGQQLAQMNEQPAWPTSPVSSASPLPR